MVHLWVGLLELKKNYCFGTEDCVENVLLAEGERELQGTIEIWNETELLEENVTKINNDMVIAEDILEMKIEIDGVRLEEMRVFPYLAMVFDKKETQDAEIKCRADKTIKLCCAIQQMYKEKRNWKVYQDKLYKTTCTPVSTFGCESWMLKEGQISKIQAVEMKYLRMALGGRVIKKAE